MRVTAIMVREWQEYLLRGRWLLLGLFLPFWVLLPLLAGGQENRLPSEFAAQMAKVAAADLPGLSAELFLRVNQSLLFLLMIPVSFSLQFAVQGLMAEKQSGTLEPLLAAPVLTWELLLGKAVAAVTPGILTTWAGWLLAIGVISFRMPAALPVPFLPGYLLMIFLVTPLISVAGALVGLAIAARAGEPRAAQQAAGLLQLPFFLGIIVLANARVAVSPASWIATALSLGLLAALLLKVAVRLFDRETILTRWR
jgi:ABC-2 type transport system permease protein